MAHYDFDTRIHQAEEEAYKDCDLLEELARLLKQEEKVIQPNQDSIEVVNIDTEEVRKEVKIGEDLEESIKIILIELLHEYYDIFAWSYEDMPGLDTDILVHRLPLREGCSPVKQKL